MSRVEAVEKSLEKMRKYFESLYDIETMTDVRHYLAPVVAQLGEISMSLAVIADKLTKEPEEDEAEDACELCYFWEKEPDEWPCKVCGDKADMFRPRTNGKEPEGEGGPKSGDH